ncbi:MAG: hypothetical protein KY461_02745 [Actinobacteria bacterium]|nr:hypothetical protein [Actinomycetota bacterium]
MDDEVLAHHLDALYGTAREDFIDERDRRVRELRDADQREESRALGRARKPTVPAWAVDQLARREADRVAELITAGQELRDAQRRAASGRGGDALKTASRRLRDLVGDLRRAAADIISASGASPASHLEDVERTLFTAAVSPEHHEELRRGVLDRPLEGAGFGGVEGLLVAPAPAPADEDDEAARAEEERRRTLQRRRLRRQHRDLERSRDDQLTRVERAGTKAEQLRARADRAEADLRAEREELDRITTALAAVEAELGTSEDTDADPAG